MRGDEDWDPDWVEERFSCLLLCSETSCAEPVVVVGRTSCEPGEYYDNDDGEGHSYMDWMTSLIPDFVLPAPDLFRLPQHCPKDVASEIRRAFSLFWCDTQAAANRVRSGVEALLDSIGVPKRRRVKGKIERISLHNRIQLFSKREPVLAASLLAVKWIGNAGSHTSELSKDDLYDAFDILNHVLDEVVEQRTKQIATLTKEINRKRGPRSKSKRRVR